MGDNLVVTVQQSPAIQAVVTPAKNLVTVINVGKPGKDGAGGSIPRSERLAQQGIYVGISAPDFITYEQWLSGVDGFWSWIDISSGVTNAGDVLTTLKSVAGYAIASPVVGSATRYLTSVVESALATGTVSPVGAGVFAAPTATPVVASGVVQPIDSSFTVYASAVIKAVAANGLVSPVIASQDGLILAEAALVAGIGYATPNPITATATRYETAAITGVAALGVAQNIIGSASITSVIKAVAALGGAVPITASFSRYVDTSLVAVRGLGIVAPVVGTVTTGSSPVTENFETGPLAWPGTGVAGTTWTRTSAVVERTNLEGFSISGYSLMLGAVEDLGAAHYATLTVASLPAGHMDLYAVNKGVDEHIFKIMAVPSNTIIYSSSAMPNTITHLQNIPYPNGTTAFQFSFGSIGADPLILDDITWGNP